jgi:hypothetical protein
MAIYTVYKGRRYRATITLADKFREVGFTEVEVSGAGRNRLGKGLWPQEDATAEIPDEITSISEIEV